MINRKGVCKNSEARKNKAQLRTDKKADYSQGHSFSLADWRSFLRLYTLVINSPRKPTGALVARKHIPEFLGRATSSWSFSSIGNKVS